MNAIRIVTRIDSTTLTLPELAPFLGKKVELIVLEEEPAEPAASGRRLGTMAGQFEVPDDFDAPLPPEVQKYFEGGDDD